MKRRFRIGRAIAVVGVLLCIFVGVLYYFWCMVRTDIISPTVKADTSLTNEINSSVDDNDTIAQANLANNDDAKIIIVADGKIPEGKTVNSLTLISSARVYLPSGVGTYNAKVACDIIAGYNDGVGFTIKSGEVFSADGALGERTLERGFVYGDMPIINDEGLVEIIKSIASGICRCIIGIATAATKADLDTTTYPFTEHKVIPGYLFDPRNEGLVNATICHDSGIDCKFINNKPYDILMKCGVDSNYVLWVELYEITYQ